MQLAIARTSFLERSVAIGRFLVRRAPLHLNHGCVPQGRNNISKSTLFIPEA